MELELRINDGGRGKYFKATNVADCVTRAIAIASGNDYKEVYKFIKNLVGYSPRNGINHKDTSKIMSKLGYKWVPKMKIGQGVICHLSKGEVPMKGNIICSCSGHVVAVINGVVNDSYDSRRQGKRAVYGYWVVSE